ncbi:hypothetical protein HYX16_04255 [Candidatus Woesearchaeota archaeon]|nr:hypothetical protein [Candidatus Woesearchaeota archaeon]
MKVNLYGKVIEGEQFYNSYLAIALKNSQSNGYKPLFMPGLIEARINAEEGSELLKNWFSTPSIRATGRTKKGNKV